MSLLAITSESLSRDLEREVPEIYVVIAKHSVLGMDDEGIREVIGCTQQELTDVLNDQLYREVRLAIGAVQAAGLVGQTEGWDALEQKALNNLVKRAELPNQDPEFLLKVASVANRAVRRASAGKEQGVLDSAHGKVARISLTSRLVQSFQRAGGVTETREMERTLSIDDGSMKNPSFEEVNSLLEVSATPALPKAIEIKTSTPKVTLEDLNEELNRRIDNA